MKENLSFPALWVEEQGSNDFSLKIIDRSLKDLPKNDLIIKVEYSSLNYKDALSASGNRGVTKKYPHTPGIDAAGTIYASNHPSFSEGDAVIVTGFDLGMNTSGGFGQFISVPAEWVIKKPVHLSLREAMIYGTAGFTAGLSVDKIIQNLKPEDGPILVSGATGGVGSLAVAILSKLSYEVHAITGKTSQETFLNAIGAKLVINRNELSEPQKRPLLTGKWSGAVDTVGGELLGNILKSVTYGGTVTTCGMVAGTDFQMSVFPFILRGITLYGIDSVEFPLALRMPIWDNLANAWKPDNLEKLAADISLKDLPQEINRILSGQQIGRKLITY
jgi:alcohol dehydrogenase